MGEYANLQIREDIKRTTGFDPGPIEDDEPMPYKKPVYKRVQCPARTAPEAYLQAALRELHAAIEAVGAGGVGQNQGWKHWCETCEGLGTIDETLGGEHFSNPRSECPDCDGRGYWEKNLKAAVMPAPAVVLNEVESRELILQHAVMDAVQIMNGCVMTSPTLQKAHELLRQALWDYSEAVSGTRKATDCTTLLVRALRSLENTEKCHGSTARRKVLMADIRSAMLAASPQPHQIAEPARTEQLDDIADSFETAAKMAHLDRVRVELCRADWGIAAACIRAITPKDPS